MNLPSPSMAVALTALFVALGGSAVAATQLTKNSVSSSHIKKNAVTGSKVKNSSLTGADVKNSSLTGADVKNNSLTGADVDESRLGTVPSAAKATSADLAAAAGFAQTAGKAADADKLGGRALSSFVTTDDVQLVQKRFAAPGAETIFRHGSLSVTAECYDNQEIDGTPDLDGIRLVISTTSDGAMFAANGGSKSGGPDPATDYLNVDTVESERVLYITTRADASDAQLLSPIDDFVAVGPDGVGFTIGGMESFGLAFDVAGSKCSIAFPVTKIQL